MPTIFFKNWQIFDLTTQFSQFALSKRFESLDSSNGFLEQKLLTNYLNKAVKVLSQTSQVRTHWRKKAASGRENGFLKRSFIGIFNVFDAFSIFIDCKNALASAPSGYGERSVSLVVMGIQDAEKQQEKVRNQRLKV